MISSTKYPTTNIYFPQICEIKMNLSKWVNFPNEVIHQMWLVMERVNCVIMIDILKERKRQEPQL